MYRIGEFSKMSKTTVKTLHFYDEIGLLKPEQIDKFTGYRLYTTNQLFSLHQIQSLRQIGLSVDEIKMILSGSNADVILQKRKAELTSELAERTDQLSRIEFILKGEQKMNYSAKIKELPECIVYSTQMTVKNYDEYFQVIPPLGAKVIGKYPDLQCITPEYCFIKYLDGEYKETNFAIEFCEAINELKPDFEDITFKKIPSVTAVCVLHKGPYKTLGQAYAFLASWIDENNYTAVDYPRESQIDGIWNKDSEDDWLTEVQIPVARK